MLLTLIVIIVCYSIYDKMDSDVQRDGRLIDTVDSKWREDVLPDEDISVPIMELPDPEPDNGNPQETLKEQDLKWNDLALGCIHESIPSNNA